MKWLSIETASTSKVNDMSDDYTHGDNFEYSEFFVDDELITLEQAMKRIKELEDMLRHIHDVTDDDSHRMMLDELLNKVTISTSE